jgi:hypothetical protein
MIRVATGDGPDGTGEIYQDEEGEVALKRQRKEF